MGSAFSGALIAEIPLIDSMKSTSETFFQSLVSKKLPAATQIGADAGVGWKF